MIKAPRWLGLMSAGYLLASSVGSAQAVARDKLVGTWSLVFGYYQSDRRDKPIVRQTLLTLQADSTWDVRVKENGIAMPGKRWDYIPVTDSTNWSAVTGRWYRAGDLLWFANPARYEERAVRIVALQDQQLVLAQNDNPQNQERFECGKRVLERVDPSKPLPLPTLSPPSPPTIQRADLVGSWVVPRVRPIERGNGGGPDTLTLQPDSTWTIVRGGRLFTGMNRVISGTWYILPGDTLWLTNREAHGDNGVIGGPGKVTLQTQQQFSLENNGDCYNKREPLVANRVKP